LTPPLLDILKAEQVKATFFVVGYRLDNPAQNAILQRAYAEGHQIASHTHTHKNLRDSSEDDIVAEMKQSEKAIVKAIGKRPNYMRPPYGAVNDKVLKVMDKLGYLAVNWSMSSHDWRHPQDPKQVHQFYLDVVQKNKPEKSHFISLAHDTQKSTLDSIKQSIRAVKKAGFKTVRVFECLLDAPAPYHSSSSSPSAPSPKSPRGNKDHECSETKHCPDFYYCSKDSNKYVPKMSAVDEDLTLTFTDASREVSSRPTSDVALTLQSRIAQRVNSALCMDGESWTPLCLSLTN
jgi:hypothetical protein